MAKKSNLPAPGAMPKGLGGSPHGEARGGPGMGTMPPRPDNKVMNPTKPAGGKAHKSMGGGERRGFYPNAPTDFPSFDGKLNKGTW